MIDALDGREMRWQALSLERLDALVAESGGRLQRIGLSATQRPLDVVARLLCGVHEGRPPTTIGAIFAGSAEPWTPVPPERLLLRRPSDSAAPLESNGGAS